MAKVHHFQYRSDKSPKWRAFYRAEGLTDEEAQRLLEMFQVRWKASKYQYQVIPEAEENSKTERRARRKWGELREWASLTWEDADIVSYDERQRMFEEAEQCEEDVRAMRWTSPEKTASDDSDFPCEPRRPKLRDVDVDYIALWKDAQQLLAAVEGLCQPIDDMFNMRSRDMVDICEVGEPFEVAEWQNMSGAMFNKTYGTHLDTIRNAVLQLDSLVAEERFQNRLREWSWEAPPSAQQFVDSLSRLRGQTEYLIQQMGLERTGGDSFWHEASGEFDSSARALRRAIRWMEVVPSLKSYLQHEARKRLHSQVADDTGQLSPATKGTGETDIPEGHRPESVARPMDNVATAGRGDAIQSSQEELASAHETGARPTDSRIEPEGMLSAAELSQRYEIDYEVLRKRLERWRKKHVVGDGWREIEVFQPNAPQYLYKPSAVEGIVASVKKGRKSSQRPAE